MTKINPIRKERYENLKKASNLPFAKRMIYYFDFFKFHFLVLFVFIILCFLILKEIIFAPEVILNGCIVNKTAITSVSDEEFISSFPEYDIINHKKQRIYFSSDIFFNDTDIESAAKLIALTSSGDMDYIICNEETFNRLCLLGLFSDIDSIPELKEKYGDALKFYDHTKNDNTEDDSLGIKPYGIDVSESAVLKNLNAFGKDEKIYLCLGINTDMSEIVFKFTEWISEK